MLNLSLSADQTLVIESTGVTLRGVQPILNGTPLEGWMCEVARSDSDQIELRYAAETLGDGTFALKVNHADAQGHIWIQYWVEKLPQDILLDSLGLRFEHVENLRQFLRNGYFS